MSASACLQQLTLTTPFCCHRLPRGAQGSIQTNPNILDGLVTYAQRQPCWREVFVPTEAGLPFDGGFAHRNFCRDNNPASPLEEFT